MGSSPVGDVGGRHYGAGMSTPQHQRVRDYWASIDARDWPTLADDVVYRYPQTREMLHGRDANVRFNAEYPGDWRIEITRLVADAGGAASWIAFSLDGTEQPGLTFFRFDADGLIAEITDFWPEPGDPPPGREHLVERY